MDRKQKFERDADVLTKVHDRIAEINDDGRYDGLCDHLAQKVRLARDTAKHAVAVGRR